jgi:hypothetical protein
LATLSVASSLALVALGDFDLTQQVLPSNPELWQTPRQSWDPFWIQLPYPMIYRVHRLRSRMMCKIIFTVPFYVPAKPIRFASLVVTPRGYKVGGHSYTTYIFPLDLPPSLCLLPYG